MTNPYDPLGNGADGAASGDDRTRSYPLSSFYEAKKAREAENKQKVDENSTYSRNSVTPGAHSSYTQSGATAPNPSAVNGASSPEGYGSPYPGGTYTSGQYTSADVNPTNLYQTNGSWQGTQPSSTGYSGYQNTGYQNTGYQSPGYQIPGYPAGGYQYGGLPAAQGYGMIPATAAPKSQAVAALLAFFLGGIGAHNFYLGHTSRAVCQLALTIFGAMFSIVLIGFVFLFAVGLWAFVEFILILMGSGSYGRDSRGIPLV